MTQEKERGEQIWRERLQRCQRQLKAKEEEMSRQSQYFENFKTQLQHKLSLARDREQILQNRIYTLEKQLLDMTVKAATGMATISEVRITAGTVTHWLEQERLTYLRGEGEGEEEKKEERRKQWQPSVGIAREGKQEGDKGKAEEQIEGGRNKDLKQNSNEVRLQGFILSLQEDLRVLLEREEDRMTERRGLMEQLQEAQENSVFLGCKVEELKAEVQQLKLSESSLMLEVEQLRETENLRLQQILREGANQTPTQSSTVRESTCPSPGISLPSCSPVTFPDSSNNQPYSTAMGHSVGSLGEGTAESGHNNTEDHSILSVTAPLNLFAHRGCKHNLSLQSLSYSTETIDEFKMDAWCSRGLLNLEESPSEESDALRKAYRSLGSGQDSEALQQDRDHLEATLQHTQEQLHVLAQENTQLKSQLRKQVEEPEETEWSSKEKIGSPSTCNGADPLQSSPTQDIAVLAEDDLVQGLNQENQALVDRIQVLLAHVELREKQIRTEQTQLREHISSLEEDKARLEQENQEQGCLITELTRKTEDDLNTIMQLQQKLEESGEQIKLDESVDNLVESMIKGTGESQWISSQQPDDLSTIPAYAVQNSNHYKLSQSSPQNTLHLSSVTDQVDQLSKTIQGLKTEQDELSGNITLLTQQQKEVALSVQAQTEEKQHLTRTVWALKEDKDCVAQSLAGLKQEKEQLTRAVCGLRDERDHFIRSMSALKEEKELLTESLSGLEKEKEALKETLSSRKRESDEIIQSLQNLQTERDQLIQTQLTMKHERDQLTLSLKSLKDQQSSLTSQDDWDKLMKAVSSLREEKQRVENSVSCLKQEEKQLIFVIQGLKVERSILQSAPPSQTQVNVKNPEQHLLNPDSAGTTKKTDAAVGTEDLAAQRCQTTTCKGNSIQEQSCQMREIESLGAKLSESQKELQRRHEETKRMYSELCQSEARRDEAERKAADEAEKVMRLTDVAMQMEESRRENEGLNAQVKELRTKLRGLVQEKTDALTLKTQIEEQYNILTAQLKAKTVALEELNTEYIAVKGEQVSKDDLSSALMSLRSRYNNIRAKYNTLLKGRSQTDLDIAPLKAKLSCLVVKCQERNSLLVRMMKTMQIHGCVDSTLKQRVDQLLSDVVLQDYTAVFTPGSAVKTVDYSAEFTPRFFSALQDNTTGSKPDQMCAAEFAPENKQLQIGITPESEAKCRELKSDEHTSISISESSANLQDCRGEVSPATTRTRKGKVNSPVPTVQQQENVPESFPVTPVLPAQMSPFAGGAVQPINDPEKFGSHHPDVKGKSSPDVASSARSPRSRLSPTSPSSGTHTGPSRRLSSPEKIINLHEQLQKTLMSSCLKAPSSRGRRHEPRKSLSFSAPADVNLNSHANKPSPSFNKPHSNSLAVTTSVQAQHTPVVTTKSAATNKSVTLFNAVASRAATLNPNIFTSHNLREVTSKTTEYNLFSSSNCPVAATAPNEAASTDITMSPILTKKVSALPKVSDAIDLGSETNSKTTASDNTAPGKSAVPTTGASPPHDGLVFAAPCTQSAHRSTERSNKSDRNTAAALDKTTRPRPGAPAEVRSAEVIKTVGQSSLMIGWERPPLDELGCSNGTFVYGYRVFIDGNFHKSVMSSACTKCIVENVDLSFPVHISVQTLGDNGLTSNSVHTTYRTSVRADQH